MKRKLLSALLTLLACTVTLTAQTYQITDIGLLNGAPTYATAINDDGIVCGYAPPDASTAKAWVFDNHSLVSAARTHALWRSVQMEKSTATRRMPPGWRMRCGGYPRRASRRRQFSFRF